MRKYSFLVYHKEVEDFLDGLMELGVLHIINKGAIDDDYAEELATEIREAEGLLKRFERRKPKDKDNGTLNGPMPPLSEITQLERRLDKHQHDRENLQTELKLMKPWGEFSWDDIDRLEEKAGIEIRFFRATERQFSDQWKNEYPLEIINRSDGKVYFIIIRKDAGVHFPLIPVALPKKRLSEIEAELRHEEERIADLGKTLDDYAVNYMDSLRESIRQARDELDYHLTAKSTATLAEDKLVLLEGWCPVNKREALEAYAVGSEVVAVESKPGDDERAPVLLKNNAFTRLFEPIGELFSLPAYSELDMTVFFAPFFLLFFGFCLGDAGYGIVLFIAATIVKMRLKPPDKKYATLIQLFGLSTTVIGFFSGTLFGIEMLKEEEFSSVDHLMFNQDEMFRIALVIGFIQIIFGMAIQAYKKAIFTGWLSALSRVGWIILLLSLVDLYVLEQFKGVSGITVWVGVALIVLFGSPKSGWLKSIGLGLADLYNITGVAGDLLSYIRLFALGVSSAILGLVVNEIAFSARGVPYVGIILTGVILLVGHTANLLLASLSAFVHPLRLTFVEFYKNAGFIGGGKPYEPFARKSQKQPESQISNS